MVLIDLLILLLFSTQDHHCMAHSNLGPPTSAINTENVTQTNLMGMGAFFFPRGCFSDDSSLCYISSMVSYLDIGCHPKHPVSS